MNFDKLFQTAAASARKNSRVSPSPTPHHMKVAYAPCPISDPDEIVLSVSESKVFAIPLSSIKTNNSTESMNIL